MGLLKATTQDLRTPIKGSVKGDAIISVGVGTSNDLRPTSGTFNLDDVDSAPTIYTASQVAGNTNTCVHADGTIGAAFIGQGTNITTGDRILYTIDDSFVSDAHNHIPGLTNGRHYFAIKVSGQDHQFKLAKTKAKALANEPIKFLVNEVFPSRHKFQNLESDNSHLDQRLSIDNALFDHGTKNPNKDLLNLYPQSRTNLQNINYDGDLDSIPHWRRYSTTVANKSFVPHSGTEWFNNAPDPVPLLDFVDRGGNINLRQPKVMGLFGSTTTVPDDVAHKDEGGSGYDGFLNLNGFVRNVVSGGNNDLAVGHIKSGVTPSATDVIPGNANYWTHHEWSQVLPRDGVRELLRTGKMKFGCKVRSPLDDNMRLNDFAGMYVKIYYSQSGTASSDMAEVIAYFKVQRKDSTGISLVTGDVPSTSLGSSVCKVAFNTPPGENALNGYSGNLGQGQRIGTTADGGVSKRTLVECETVFVEDLRSFDTIECEFDLPDIPPPQQGAYLSNTGHARAQVIVGLFYADNGANLMGMNGGEDDDGTVNFNSAISVGDRCFARLLPSSTADKKTMGYQHDGTRFVNACEDGALVRKAANSTSGSTTARAIVNDTQVRSNGLVANEPYFIDSLEGITQAEMHDLAGTTPGKEIDADDMIIGRTYTISAVGSSAATLAYIKIKDEIHLAPGHILGVDDRVVGYAFTFAGYTTVSDRPAADVKVTEGGYPRATLFVPTKTTSDTKGYFTRTSGSVQFYSPFIDYVYEDPNDVAANMNFIFGGATIGDSKAPTNAGDVFEFPTGASSWAGFTCSNKHIFPFRFYGDDGSGNGGRIQFTGAVPGGGTSDVKFVFNHMPHPDTSPTFTTSTVTVSGATPATYTINIPKRTYSIPANINTNPEVFNEVNMYLVERDKPTVMRDLVITDYTDS